MAPQWLHNSPKWLHKCSTNTQKAPQFAPPFHSHKPKNPCFLASTTRQPPPTDPFVELRSVFIAKIQPSMETSQTRQATTRPFFDALTPRSSDATRLFHPSQLHGGCREIPNSTGPVDNFQKSLKSLDIEIPGRYYQVRHVAFWASDQSWFFFGPQTKCNRFGDVRPWQLFGRGCCAIAVEKAAGESVVVPMLSARASGPAGRRASFADRQPVREKCRPTVPDSRQLRFERAEFPNMLF
jgi:hypothetical protein